MHNFDKQLAEGYATKVGWLLLQIYCWQH